MNLIICWDAEIMKEIIKQVVKNLNKALTLDGKEKVIEDKKKLLSDYIIHKSDPEPFTKDNIILPILKFLKLK